MSRKQRILAQHAANERGKPTFTRFSANGRPFTTASCARRTLAAATSFIASVIFCVFFTELIRSRVSFSPATTCSR